MSNGVTRVTYLVEVELEDHTVVEGSVSLRAVLNPVDLTVVVEAGEVTRSDVHLLLGRVAHRLDRNGLVRAGEAVHAAVGREERQPSEEAIDMRGDEHAVRTLTVFRGREVQLVHLGWESSKCTTIREEGEREREGTGEAGE